MTLLDHLAARGLSPNCLEESEIITRARLELFFRWYRRRFHQGVDRSRLGEAEQDPLWLLLRWRELIRPNFCGVTPSDRVWFCHAQADAWAREEWEALP